MLATESRRNIIKGQLTVTVFWLVVVVAGWLWRKFRLWGSVTFSAWGTKIGFVQNLSLCSTRVFAKGKLGKWQLGKFQSPSVACGWVFIPKVGAVSGWFLGQVQPKCQDR